MYTKTLPRAGRCWLELLTLVLVTQVIGACNTSTPPTAPSPPPAPPTVRTISIIGPASIAPGAFAQFRATAIYSDGTSADVTATVTWTTSDAAVLTISPYGRATARQEGQAHVTGAKDGVQSGADVIVLLRPGTYRLSGRLLWGGQPAGGVFLNAVDGTGAEIVTSTDSSGRYVLSGLVGVVRITFSTDLTPPLTCTVSVTGHTVMADIDMAVTDPVTSGCARGQ